MIRVTGKTKEIAILQGDCHFNDRIEISEHIHEDLKLLLMLKRTGGHVTDKEAKIMLTKESASQLSDVLDRWSKGII